MNCYKCHTPLPDDARFCLSCGADVSGEAAERTQPVDADPELREKLQAELGGDFVIERELGRGGMAVVFLARDVHLGRNVAVKLLPPELTFGSSAGLVERFKREARTAATLDHPHIIPIYRVSTTGKLLWYVMKYLEGEALDNLLKREHQLAFDRAGDILKQVAEALSYAHRKNVIHRDVKPANVMLDEEGWVTVTDFGIAKALDTSSLTGSGSMIGTPYYMSPEQCSGKKVTGASDQYSLGVMAYQMVSGHLPFTGETVIDIVKKHCMDPVPPLPVLRPNTPSGVVAVIERALSKSPEERFPSVTDFAAAFGRTVSAASSSVAERAAEQDSRSRPSKTALVRPVPFALMLRSAQGDRPERRSRLRLVALGAVLLAVGVGIALWQPWSRVVNSAQAPAAGRQPPAVQTSADSLHTQRAVAESLAAPSRTPAAPPSPALLVLRRLPPRATSTLDGVRVRGSRVTLSPGMQHVVQVVARGFQPWTDSITAGPGDTVTRTVELRASLGRVAAAPGAILSEQASEQPNAPAQPSRALPGEQPPAPVGTAFITVGSRPLAVMTVNGKPVPNPTAHYAVPAGIVRLHFVVTDSTGVWSVDTSITVAAGETRILGRIPLVRRP